MSYAPDPATGPLVEISGVTKSYADRTGATPVLRGVDLTLGRGETLALTGESGSGKSTLLALIAGLDRPDAGRIRVAGEDVTRLDEPALARLRRRRIGIVFQHYNLIPSLSVASNLSFQSRLCGKNDPDWTARLAGRLGLADLLDRYPEQLSGGQQQRVAIGRALAPRPDLVLADEPTGNLDEETGAAVISLMLDLVRETDCALLMVTHSAPLAARLARRCHLTHGRIA